MKPIFTFMLFLLIGTGHGQKPPYQVSEQVTLSGQKKVMLDLTFAEEISIKTWEHNEVKVEVEVTLAEGLSREAFSLTSETSSSEVTFRMDAEKWSEANRRYYEDYCRRSSLRYTVYLPPHLSVQSGTIDGSYLAEYFGQPLELKTISGDIDLTIGEHAGVDFHAKTISGEVYSDLTINFPSGTGDMRQVVGMNINAKINNGGTKLDLETISGNVYLRKN